MHRWIPNLTNPAKQDGRRFTYLSISNFTETVNSRILTDCLTGDIAPMGVANPAQHRSTCGCEGVTDLLPLHMSGVCSCQT